MFACKYHGLFMHLVQKNSSVERGAAAQCAGIGNKASSNRIWKYLMSKIRIIRFSWASKDTQLYKLTVFWILMHIRLFSVLVVTVWCCILCLQACSAGSGRELYSPHQKQHQVSCVQLHPVRLRSHHLTQGWSIFLFCITNFIMR